MVGGGGGTVPAVARSTTSVSSPLRSRTDRMPDSSPSGRNALPGLSASVKPPCHTVSGCAALSRIAPGASGMNHASTTVAGVSSGPWTNSVPSPADDSVPRRRSRHFADRAPRTTAPAPSGEPISGGQVEPEVALLRHADIAANQPFGVRLYADCTGSRGRDGHRQQQSPV